MSADARRDAARLLGRLGGIEGGRARAAALSAERRSEIARDAARARWGHDRQVSGGTNAARRSLLAVCTRIVTARAELRAAEAEFDRLLARATRKTLRAREGNRVEIESD